MYRSYYNGAKFCAKCGMYIPDEEDVIFRCPDCHLALRSRPHHNVYRRKTREALPNEGTAA